MQSWGIRRMSKKIIVVGGGSAGMLAAYATSIEVKETEDEKRIAGS